MYMSLNICCLQCVELSVYMHQVVCLCHLSCVIYELRDVVVSYPFVATFNIRSSVCFVFGSILIMDSDNCVKTKKKFESTEVLCNSLNVLINSRSWIGTLYCRFSFDSICANGSRNMW